MILVDTTLLNIDYLIITDYYAVMLKSALGLLILFSFTAHAGVNALGEPKVTWQKRSIHVCWHEGVKDNFEASQKKAVQQIVEQEYTIEKVGITFYGWEECLNLPQNGYDLEIFQDVDIAHSNPEVEMYRKASVEGFAVMGQGSVEQVQAEQNQLTGEVKKTDGYLNRNLRTPIMYLMFRPLFRFAESDFKSLEELQLTALHEFGHVAGLRHEHIRPEAKTDFNCQFMSSFKIDETILDTAENYEEYDPNSIMNYCWNAELATNGNVVMVLPNIPDKTLYTASTTWVDHIVIKKVKSKKTGKIIEKEVIEKMKKITYTIRIGLSAKDISTLNKLYPKQQF